MNEHIEELTGRFISQIDQGALGREITRQIRSAVNDIRQRPKTVAGKATGARKLKIQLSFSPRLQYDKATETEELIGIDMEPTVVGMLPSVVGGVTDIRLSKTGAPMLNKAFPGQFEQQPLPFTQEPAEGPEEE